MSAALPTLAKDAATLTAHTASDKNANKEKKDRHNREASCSQVRRTRPVGR